MALANGMHSAGTKGVLMRAARVPWFAAVGGGAGVVAYAIVVAFNVNKLCPYLSLGSKGSVNL